LTAIRTPTDAWVSRRRRKPAIYDAHAFVYVLEGQIIMQLKGQPAVTLKAGQAFYEGPTDVHVVGRNASNTEPLAAQ
jgi:quercetin dioxygenase-like cupin family protein